MANPDGDASGDPIQPLAWQLDVGEGVLEAAPPEGTETVPGPMEEPARRRTSLRPAEASPPPPPLRILEALLFVGGEPLTAERAGQVIRGLASAQVHEAIDTLNHTYREQGRPYQIQKHEQGYVLALRPGYRFLAEKLYGGVRETRLSPAAVDVLAIVAYKQPISKQEVDTLRGHESGALIRQLVRRNLIAVVSRGEAGGRDVQYGTSPRFLELFGLTSLDDLPETEDLQRL